MDIHFLSGADLARCFGVDKAMVTRWKKAGMPERKGKYSLPMCIKWRLEQAQKPAETSKEKSEIDTEKDRWLAAVRREQARKAKLERLEKEGRLVDSTEAMMILSEEVVSAKTAFRGMGRKLAPRCSGAEIAEIEAEINGEVDQILAKMASRLDKKKREKK